MMPAYFLVDIQEIRDAEAMQRYRARVFATVRKFGGKYLTSGGEVTIIEGDWRPTFPVLIEFPSAKHFRDWYDSPEYRDLLKQRLAATRCTAILLEANPWNGQ